MTSGRRAMSSAAGHHAGRCGRDRPAHAGDEGKLGAMIMLAGLSDDEIVIMPVDVVMPGLRRPPLPLRSRLGHVLFHRIAR
jgi:hypothetical protein